MARTNTRGGVRSRWTTDAEMGLEEWVSRYFKPERLNREPGYGERSIASHQPDLEGLGSTVISRHDSSTGYTEWYVPARGFPGNPGEESGAS